MRDEIERIELIDADPGAFGQVAGSPTAESSAPSTPRTGAPGSSRPFPRKIVLVGLACLAVVGFLAAGLVWWSPWKHDPRLTLPDPRATEFALSDRLIFDPEPSELRTALLGTADDAVESPWTNGSSGYFFGEPDATFDPEDGDDRWLGFFARSIDDPGTPFIFGQRTIAGAPAEVSDESKGALIRLAWGPVDGWVFTAAASHVTVDEAIAVAEQLRMIDGRPVLLDRRLLPELDPLGPFGDYVTIATLTSLAQDTGRPIDDINGLYYGFGGASVVSMPGNESAIDMVRFVLDVDVREGTVHGRRAVGWSKGAGPFGGIDRTTVLWWEGGRVVLVAGDGDLDATFALAERVRPATDAEWSTVADVG